MSFSKNPGAPKFYGKINLEFQFWAFYELLQDLGVQNKSNNICTSLWPLGKIFFGFPLQIMYLKAQLKFQSILLSRFGFKLKVHTVWGIQY